MANESNMQLDLGGLFEYNSTFDYENYEYKEDSSLETTSDGTAIIPVLYSVTIFLGLLGHGLVLGVLWQKCRSWSMTDTFIFHLSMADILLLLTLPLWAVEAANEWIFDRTLCKLAGTIFQVHFYCGIFLLAFISLNFYLSIVHAINMYPRKKPWLIQLSCIAIWFFSLLLSIPDWYYLETSNSRQEGKTECVHSYLFDRRCLGFRLLYHVVGFLLPVMMLLFCYSFILLRLQRIPQGLKKQRPMRVILALVVAFFISWTPYNITLLVDTIHSACSYSTDLSRQSRWTAVNITAVLGFLHCCLNPFIYFGLSEKFRHWVLTVLRCGGCAVNNGDVFSLWDLEQMEKGASGSPEEKCSVYPLSDLGQVIEEQNTSKMHQNQQDTKCRDSGI